jgi:hypothetical protein
MLNDPRKQMLNENEIAILMATSSLGTRLRRQPVRRNPWAVNFDPIAKGYVKNSYYGVV